VKGNGGGFNWGAAVEKIAEVECVLALQRI
jgi:hypothetical protein